MYIISSFTSGYVLNSAYVLAAARVAQTDQAKNQANLTMAVGRLGKTLF
jgi:hypothetical protein